MADTARARRLAKRIAAIVATELEHSVKDPRLAMVTVTDAQVTPDLREATIFYTVYGSDIESKDSAVALASATGVLRSAVGRQTGIKFTPTLAFRTDAVPENASRIDELLAAARAADAEVAELAAGAHFAGDADPYRAPREPEEGEAGDDEAGDDGAGAGDGGSARIGLDPTGPGVVGSGPEPDAARTGDTASEPLFAPSEWSNHSAH